MSTHFRMSLFQSAILFDRNPKSNFRGANRSSDAELRQGSRAP